MFAGNVDECKKFFETLYKFVYLQGTYLKPHVSVYPFQDIIVHLLVNVIVILAR